MRAEAWVGGQPMSTICFYDQLNWTTHRLFGDWEAGFRVHAPARWRHSALRRGNEVVIKYGGKRTFLGDVGSWNRDTGEVYVRGRIRAGEGYLVDPTDDAATVVAAAIAATPPLNWTVDTTGFPAGALVAKTTAADPEPMYLLDYLEAIAAKSGTGQGVFTMGPDGRLRYVERPTVPSLQVWPAAVDLGEAGGPDRATAVRVKYIRVLAPVPAWQVGGAYAFHDQVVFSDHFWTALIASPTSQPGEDDTEWRDDGATSEAVQYVTKADDRFTPFREVLLDGTDLGPMLLAQAQTMADNALAKLLEPVFLNDIPGDPLLVADWQGGPINPLVRRADALTRVWGTSHPRLGKHHIDVLAGEVTVSDAESLHPTVFLKTDQKPITNLLELVRLITPPVERTLAPYKHGTIRNR